MPRSPEYVKAKSYERFKVNSDAFWRTPGLDKKGRKTKPPRTKTKPEPEQEKPPEEKEPKERDTQPTKPPKTKRTAGEGDTEPVEPVKPVGGPGKDVVPRGTQAVEERDGGAGGGGRGGPGQDIERAPVPGGNRPPQWGGRWEVVRPDALEAGRPAIGPAPPRTAPPVPDRPSMTSGPQFREIGPGQPSVNAVEQRQANLAELVRQHHESLGRSDALSRGRTPTGDTGEIVSEGAGPYHEPKNQTIHTGEIVGFRSASGTQGDIPVVPKVGGGRAAIEPPSHDKVTGPVPRVTSNDRTQPLTPVRSGDTGELPRTEYTHDKTDELPKQRAVTLGDVATVAAATARGAAKGVAKGRAVEAAASLAGPEVGAPVTAGFALRGAAKGAAQGVAKVAAQKMMSSPDRGEVNLAAAQEGRSTRASNRPPSIAPSRQLAAVQPPTVQPLALPVGPRGKRTTASRKGWETRRAKARDTSMQSHPANFKIT